MIFAPPCFSQFCLCVCLAVCFFGGLSGAVCAHEYENGFVERSLTITIRDGVGYGEYQIGLNANTADRLLRVAGQLSELREKVDRETAVGKKPNAVGTGASAKGQLGNSAGQARPDGEAVASLTADVAAADVVAAEAAAAEARRNQNAALGVGEHLTDLATIKRFGEFQTYWFAGRLRFTGNGLPIELSKVSVQPATRHPYSVVVKFQFSLVANKTAPKENKAAPFKNDADADAKSDPSAGRVVDLKVTDELFDGHHGATRYALRSRGSTMVLRSNAAPVLVRAERVEVNRDAVASEVEKATAVIEAKLMVGSR